MGDTTEKDGDSPYASAINCTSVLPGYEVEFHKVSQEESGAVRIRIDLARAKSVRSFSMFINSLMWVLALVILSITFICLTSNRKVELAMLSFFGAMLFAFPAVRNLQPFVPPLGSMTDFYATFWAQGIAALSIVVCGGLWVLRDHGR